MSFVHLHRHSEFSRLDGVGTAKQYADRAAELGQEALAQTDHGTMSGALHHVEACRQAGIKSIVGIEAYYRPARDVKERQAWHLCLFAQNIVGWHNLMRIVSISHAEIEDGGGFYQYPRVDLPLLRKFSDGVACSTACISSFLSGLILKGDSASASQHVTELRSVFGDRLWVEIMPHDFDEQRTLNLALIGIANERGIPVIATNDAHFPYKEWSETQQVARILGSRMTWAKVEKDKEKREEAGGYEHYLWKNYPTLYLAHEEEMRLWFDRSHAEIPERVIDEAIENTVLMADTMKWYAIDKSFKLPHIPDLKKSSEETLREWIEEGLTRLDETYPPEHWDQWPYAVYLDRVDSEFAVLESKGVIDYFVMLGDVVRWAKSQGIRVGIGRGSAAGCLISYLVGITAVDPISYGLLFERFLNPERRGMPDIDIDFDGERRAEVKAYLASKYGQDHVADIMTHQRFQPKKVLGDLCRIYGINLIETRLILDTIDIRQDDEETTLEEILPNNERLQEFREEYPEIWEHALRLEGTISNTGKHAAGVVVTPEPIAEYMALERGKRGDLVTSWSDAADFAVISDYGFLKYDFLGITGLTKHEYACRLIAESTAEHVRLDQLDVLRSPFAVDEDVMRGFREGFTVGIFQFASRGMTNLIRDIEPDETTLDLAAANALYRPGPMKGGVTWDFAKRKHNLFLRRYWNEEVRPILEETYGIVAYQEQVMEISKRLADFSGAEADDLRKAMGKLYRIKGGTAAKDFMGQFEKKWFSGTEAINLDRKLADEIWHKMLEFGHYGFNKSHSVCYALQAYQDMWLKMKYPAQFYAALLTYEDDDDKRKDALREAKALGIEVVFPDINKSDAGYTVKDGALVLGLAGIKGVGPNAAPEIIKGRPWLSIDDLLTRATGKIPLRPLIESGATDSIADRAHMLSHVPKVISAKARQKLEAEGDEAPHWCVFEHLKHNTKLKEPRPVPEITYKPTETELSRVRGGLLDLPIGSSELDAGATCLHGEQVVDARGSRRR